VTRLDGQVAVVTGGNRGIGLGLAEGLAAAGATVAIWARDVGRNAEACVHLGEFAPGAKAVAYACDVSDEGRVEAAMAARHRVRCNALLPGWTETEMIEPGKENVRWVEATIKRTPVRRWGRPADLRDIAAYLADPSLAFHTGDSIVVDGGYSIF
jgi:NAD(P)-dependent dehydrogenase (short-subunit alcohol dehydrogenase family)